MIDYANQANNLKNENLYNTYYVIEYKYVFNYIEQYKNLCISSTTNATSCLVNNLLLLIVIKIPLSINLTLYLNPIKETKINSISLSRTFLSINSKIVK